MTGGKLNVFLVLVLLLHETHCLAGSRTHSHRELWHASSVDNNRHSDDKRSGKSLRCIPMLKHFEVELERILKAGEGVGLTGDHIKLGQWQIDKSVELKPRRRKPLKWFIKIPMCSAVRIYFRFFIYFVDSTGSKRIRLWEGQQHSRVFEAYEMYHNQGQAKFGNIYDLAFGGGVQNEKGWLRGEYVLQFKFIWRQHIRFTAFSHFIRSTKYNIKVSAFGSTDNRRYLPNQDSDTEIEVSRSTRQRSRLRPQTPNGEYYRPGTILVFHITTSNGMNNLYTISIRSKEGETLGEVIIPASLLLLSEGILELPIYNSLVNYRVGWLTLPFLKIKAMPNALDFSMRTSFHHYWPQNWPTLDVSQRGLGRSVNYHTARAIESTIHSFLNAYHEHSSMIELNVQLTKDYVPVVWNDKGFYTTGLDAMTPSLDLKFMYIHDLTYGELLVQRVFVHMNGAMVELSHLNSPYVNVTQRIFPTLFQVFNYLPLTLGIIMEVKWPQLLASGTMEYFQALDKNRYVDVILLAAMRHSCGRPLIFSSFDADICTMIRFKQPMFPTILQIKGEQSYFEPYADLRTLSPINAINFAQSSDILGTSIYDSDLLLASDRIDLAYQMQQVIFVWGNLQNSSQSLNYFRQMQVAGLIYDHVERNPSQSRKHIDIFAAPELKRIFLRQCVAAGNVSIVEGTADTHSPFWPRFRSADEL